MPTENSRTFGIEIEMFHRTMDRYAVAAALQAEGINVSLGRYGDPHAGCWILKTDGSIRANGHTMELISPSGDAVLRFGDDGLAVVRKIGEILTRIGCMINKSCGFHVHFGASDITVTEAKKIVERYAAFEPIIDNIMPLSRRGYGRTYINSLRGGVARRILSAQVSNLMALASHQGSRYHKVNLCSFQAHGTIEFRHHGGTVDAEKMEMWIRFLNSFINTSRILANNGTVSTVTPPIAAGTMPRNSKKRAIADLIRQGLTSREIGERLNINPANVVWHSTLLVRDHGVEIRRTRMRDGNVRFDVIRWFGDVATGTDQVVDTPRAAEHNDNLFDGCDESVVSFYRRRTANLMSQMAQAQAVA